MHKPLYKLWFSNSKLLMRETSSPWSAELPPLCTEQTFTYNEKLKQNSSYANQLSITQTPKCDHAKQMQLQVLKSCSAFPQSKSHPKSQAFQLSHGCEEDASRDTRWLGLTNWDCGFRDDWPDPLLHREAFSWEMEGRNLNRKRKRNWVELNE